MFSEHAATKNMRKWMKDECQPGEHKLKIYFQRLFTQKYVFSTSCQPKIYISTSFQTKISIFNSFSTQKMYRRLSLIGSVPLTVMWLAVYLWPRLTDLLSQLQAAVERCQQVIAQTGCDVTVTKPLLHQWPILHTLPDQINQSVSQQKQPDRFKLSAKCNVFGTDFT